MEGQGVFRWVGRGTSSAYVKKKNQRRARKGGKRRKKNFTNDKHLGDLGTNGKNQGSARNRGPDNAGKLLGRGRENAPTIEGKKSRSMGAWGP